MRREIDVNDEFHGGDPLAVENENLNSTQNSNRGNYLTAKLKAEGWTKVNGKLVHSGSQQNTNIPNSGNFQNSNQNSNTGNENSAQGTKFDFEKMKKAYVENKEAGSGENLGGENPGQPGAQPAPGPVNMGEHVSGKALIALVDTICPLVALIGVKVITRGKKKIDIGVLRLTQSEKEMLEPFSDAAAYELLQNLSPVQLFVIVLLAIYGGKVMAHVSTVQPN